MIVEQGVERSSLSISEELLRLVRREAESAYPEECCGVLVGAVDGPDILVRQAVPTSNVSRDRASGYEIPASELVEVVSRARAAGSEIVGYYHSHPDRRPQPSSRDRREGWPGVSYLIVSVRAGIVEDVKSWRMKESGVFESEAMTEPGAGGLKEDFR